MNEIPPLDLSAQRLSLPSDDNPFQKTKMKLKVKLEEQSIKTSTSSSKKEGDRQILDEHNDADKNLPHEEWSTITMKQVNEK